MNKKKKKRKQFPFMYHSNEATGDNRQSQPTAARDNFFKRFNISISFQSQHFIERKDDCHKHTHTLTHTNDPFIHMHVYNKGKHKDILSFIRTYVWIFMWLYVCIYLQHIHIQTVIMFMTHKSFKSFTRQCIAGYVLCISVSV